MIKHDQAVECEQLPILGYIGYNIECPTENDNKVNWVNLAKVWAYCKLGKASQLSATVWYFWGWNVFTANMKYRMVHHCPINYDYLIIIQDHRAFVFNLLENI